MLKSETRKELLREREKLEKLKAFKFCEDNLRRQQTKHIKIIKIKIERLEKELKDE